MCSDISWLVYIFFPDDSGMKCPYFYMIPEKRYGLYIVPGLGVMDAEPGIVYWEFHSFEDFLKKLPALQKIQNPIEDEYEEPDCMSRELFARPLEYLKGKNACILPAVWMHFDDSVLDLKSEYC